MPPHPTPSDLMENGNMLYAFAQWANTVTAGFFWTGMLIVFGGVIFIASNKLKPSKAFGFSSFATMNGAIMLAVLDLMPWITAWVFITMGMFGLIALLLKE